MQSSKKKIKIAIVVLAILLGVSVLTLGGTFIYRYVTADRPTVVTVPDNIIDPDPAPASNGDAGSNDAASADGTSSGSAGKAAGSAASKTSGSAAGNTSSTSSANIADALTLHKRSAEDNITFKTDNMFPGDAETRYFCVKVYYKDDIVVRYHADIRDGYEKLAEVLKVKIRMLDEDEVLYDGLMRDMPEAVKYNLATDKSTQSELYYEITAYLDTDVGNEYMDKDLVADFRWWVEETQNLDPPKTGDATGIYMWCCLAAVSMATIVVLAVIMRRKEEKKDA